MPCGALWTIIPFLFSFLVIVSEHLDECTSDYHPSLDVLEWVFEEMVHNFYHFVPYAIKYTYKYTLSDIVYVHFANSEEEIVRSYSKYVSVTEVGTRIVRNYLLQMLLEIVRIFKNISINK